MTKSNLAFRFFIAALLLVAATVTDWRLSNKEAAAIWLVVVIPAALLMFEIVGIIQTYQKRKETLDKVLRGITLLNLVMLFAVVIGLMVQTYH
jgi:chromate transport protein ChrA